MNDIQLLVLAAAGTTFSDLSFHPASVNSGDGREASRDVCEISLVLEDVLGLGPDPVHLAAVCQVRLVAHYEGERQQGNNGYWLLSSEHRISVFQSEF